MALVPITLALGNYDINRGLLEGSITPKGVSLTALTYRSPERHRLMARFDAFDACEFSLATFLVMRDQGAPLVAIPAFPHRRFRHGYLFVKQGSDIDEPRRLEGRRVGLRAWETTAGVWLRGILQDEYGVDLRKVEWVTTDDEDADFAPPDRFTIRRVELQATLSELLENGELDAMIYPEAPAARAGSMIRPLFGDSKSVEAAYFAKTSIFPIMHTVVIKAPLVATHPWLPASLLTALTDSKDAAFQQMRDPRVVSLAWLREALDEQARILGPDPWAYGLEANRRTVETLIRYAHEQGMIASRPSADELFHPTTTVDLPAYVG